ncbi:hypothetical protein [Dokdonella sp.]|uniref:hypothetical protein n=1 Tax=Dokdonella sp. TaxID=2291710 RepID=UPI003527E9A1
MKKIAFVCGLLIAGVASAQGGADPSGLFGVPTGLVPDRGTFNTCSGVDSVYSQDLDVAGFGGASTADAELDFTIFEGAVDGAGVLTTLPAGTTTNMRFWALSIEFDPAVGFVATCTEDDVALTGYNISFFDDNAGQPGTLLGSTTATVTSSVDTGIPFAFTTIREIDVALATPLNNTGVVHVGIQRQQGVNAASGNACLALVVDEQVVGTYDDNANQFDGTAFTATGDDFPICLAGGGGDVPLAPAIELPSMSTFGLMLLALALMLGSIVFIRRRA